MNKVIYAILIFTLGWIAGIVHSFVAHGKQTEDERFVLNQVEQAMAEKKPFRLLGQYAFYPTPNGYQVIEVKK